MKKIEISEFLSLVVGLCIFLVSYFIIKIPLSLNRLSLYESYSLKYTLIILGISIMIFAIISIFSKKSFFHIKRTRIFLSNITIFFISIFFCLIILEICLQFFSYKSSYKESLRPDDVLHHSLIPNISTRLKTQEWDIKININNDGLRDDEITNKKKDFRILMLGDSYTWGFGVEKNETFSELLEQKFNKTGLDVDVINAGIVSYSPILEYIYLRQKGLKYKPDVVILNFDASDLQDDYNYEKLAKFDDAKNVVGVPYSKSGNNKTILNSIFEKIKTVNFVISLLDRIYSRSPNKKELDLPYAYDIKYNKYAVTMNKTSKDEESYWNRTLKYISLINKLCNENNITFILVTYPYGHQIDPKEWNLGRHTYGFGDNVVYSDRMKIILENFSKKNNIIFISMFEDFKKSKIKPLFFPYDGHFNKKGHILASEILFSKLTEKIIISKNKNII